MRWVLLIVAGVALLATWAIGGLALTRVLQTVPSWAFGVAFVALWAGIIGHAIGHRSGRKEAIAKLQAELASMKGEEPLHGEVLGPERAEAFRAMGARLVEEATGLPSELPRIR